MSGVSCLAYFFDALGLALARFSFRTEGRVARGLTGDLARWRVWEDLRDIPKGYARQAH